MLQFTDSLHVGLLRARRWLARTWSTTSAKNVIFGVAAGLLIGLLSLYSPWLGLIAVVGVVFALASLSRPMVLAYTMIAATALTSGMPRGRLVPLLRPNEAAMVLVTALAVPAILFSRKRAKPALRAMDGAMLLYVVTTVLAPAAVYIIRGIELTQGDIMALVAPAQYLLLYVVFQYLPDTDEDRRRLTLMIMISAAIVALIGLLQAARIGFVVDFLNAWYPSSHLRQALEYNRVTSIVSGWNVFGILMMMNLLIVRATFITGVRLSPAEKVIVWASAGLSAAALLASGSFAGIIGLGIGLLIVGRFDQQNFQRLLLLGVLLALAAVALWPIIAERLAFQYREGNSIVPQTLLYRFELWGTTFIPAIREYGLWGLVPDFSEAFDWGYAESQYFYLLLRSGLISLLGHLIWTFIVVLWLYERVIAYRGFARTISLSALAILIVLTVAGLTNSVFSFSGAIDYLWILLGLVASRERAA